MLEKLEKELQHQEATVQHIRGLLKRADEKRLQHPGEVRRWNKVLDNLETALDEAKGRVEKCERELRRERERVGFGKAPAAAPAAEQAPQAPNGAAASLTDAAHPEAAAAAQTILNAPLDAVESVPLEQVAMAQHYLVWRNDHGLANGDDKRLAGRIELAIQGGGALPGAMDDSRPEDRRCQHALRALVDKMASNQSDMLTFRELELAVDCYSILSRRPNLAPSEERLKRILARVVAQIMHLSADLQRKVETPP